MTKNTRIRLGLQSRALSVSAIVLLGTAACSSDDTSAPGSGDSGSDGTADEAGETGTGIDAATEAGSDAGVPDSTIAPDAADATADTALEDAGAPDVVEASVLADSSLDDGSLQADVAADGPTDVGPVAPVDTTAQLVGYWKFDELTGTLVHDSSGNGNDGNLTAGGTLVAGGFPAATFPNPGSLSLDGNGGTAVLGVNGLPAVDGPKTISMWVNYAGIPLANATILALTNSTLACGVQIGIRGGHIAVTGWGGRALVNNLGAPAPGGWHNIVYTFDGTVHTLYVDSADGGAPATSVAVPQSCPTIQNTVGTWATHAPPYDEFYGGGVDDLRIYTGVLNAAQIGTLAAGGNPVLTAPDSGADGAADAGGSDAGGSDAGGSDAAPTDAADASGG